MNGRFEVIELLRDRYYISIPIDDSVSDVPDDDVEWVNLRAACPVCHVIYRFCCDVQSYAYLIRAAARDMAYERDHGIEKFWMGCSEHGFRQEEEKPRRRKRPAYRR